MTMIAPQLMEGLRGLPHRRFGNVLLLRGDCLDHIADLPPGCHVITDPPYEAITHAAKAAPRRGLRRDGGPETRPLGFAAIDPIRAEVVRLAEAVCSGWFLAFCTAEGVRPWADLINASRLRYKRAMGWVKPDGAPQFNGQGPGPWGEMIVAAWGGAGYARWNGGGRRGVYTVPVNPPGRTGCHPTEKPLALMEALVADFTAPDDLVLDPFAGSGSTLIACARLGRPAIGIEIDPAFYALACARLEAEGGR